jgi:hypothetical protein
VWVNWNGVSILNNFGRNGWRKVIVKGELDDLELDLRVAYLALPPLNYYISPVLSLEVDLQKILRLLWLHVLDA